MKPLSYFILSCLLSLVFIYAGVVKAMDTSSFYQDVLAYHILPDQWAWIWAHFLPWLEVVTGIALLVRPAQLASSLIIASLLLLFVSALLSAWVRGLNIDCGCLGDGGAPSSYSWDMIRDAVMLLSTLYLFRSALKQRSATEALSVNL